MENGSPSALEPVGPISCLKIVRGEDSSRFCVWSIHLLNALSEVGRIVIEAIRGLEVLPQLVGDAYRFATAALIILSADGPSKASVASRLAEHPCPGRLLGRHECVAA